MNFLILTPDGVGSTYLQRALTVYLNSAGLDYCNTHELLNGLELDKTNMLFKNFDFEYSQSVGEISSLLESNQANLVSRIAQYHVVERQKVKREDYAQFYKLCNRMYGKVIHCTRDPFEYALSWGIRKNTRKLNVFSIEERIKTHGENIKQEIDLEYFIAKLNQYKDYDYWVSENFFNTESVEYDLLHSDVDVLLQKLTGHSHKVKDRFGSTLQDYSRVRYLISKYMQTKEKYYLFDKSRLKGTVDLYNFIKNLEKNKKLPNGIPIKMNTMADKKKRIINFEEARLSYNNWAKNSNQYNMISKQLVEERIASESILYANQ